MNAQELAKVPTLIHEQYKLNRKEIIGKGSFGWVFLVRDVHTIEKFAAKVEPKTKNSLLYSEHHILQTVQNSEGFTKVHFFGEQDGFYILVIDLLSKNLDDVNRKDKRKLSLEGLAAIAVQAVTRLEELHSKGFLHRDMKPENLIFGTGKHKDMVYLIDFGLSKRYIDSRTGVHIPFRTGKSLTGTPRYTSIGAHIGMELDRRDDLESLCYVLLYLLEGTLPWVGIKCSDATSKYRLIGEMKLSLSSEVLCAGAPLQLCAAFNYTKALQFGAQPDYGYLRHLFSEMVLPAHYSGLLLAGTVQSLLYYEFSGLTGFGKGKAEKGIFGGLGENGGKTGRKLEEGAAREGGRRLNSRERKEDEKRDHKKGFSNTNPFRAANTNVSQRVILNQNQLSGFQDLVVSQRTGSSSFDTSSGGTTSIDRPWSLPHLDVGLMAGGGGNGGKSGGWEKTQFPTSSSLWRTHTLADESNAARNSPLIGKGKMMHGSSRSPIVSHKQLHSFSYASSPKKAGGKRMLLNEQEGKNNRWFDRTHSMDDPDSTSRSRESDVAARRVSLDDGWLGVGKDELDGSSSLDFGDGDDVVKRGKGGVGGSRGRDDGEGSREVLLPSLFRNDEFGGKGMNGSSLPHLHGMRRQADRVDSEDGEVGKKGLWKLSGSGKEEAKDVVGEGGKEREKERGTRGVGQGKTTAHLSLDRNPGNRRRRISEAISGYVLEPQKGGRTNESGVGRGVITTSPLLSKSALGMGRELAHARNEPKSSRKLFGKGEERALLEATREATRTVMGAEMGAEMFGDVDDVVLVTQGPRSNMVVQTVVEGDHFMGKGGDGMKQKSKGTNTNVDWMKGIVGSKWESEIVGGESERSETSVSDVFLSSCSERSWSNVSVSQAVVHDFGSIGRDWTAAGDVDVLG
ncbi:putative Casein kinase I [Blattamonas nauphoetae]|uniref:non-specific serine/threonine protein kinase n=1 Tax=Blattamonas nauphoetae TaxID=2049346 RepID=A0ABQ9YBN5_9EUKA|nr:putative Casein kinase I [Blattamonas nauphoetae]